MTFTGYYNSEGVLQYCYQGNQYTWNPAVWGYYPGWTFYFTGDCVVEENVVDSTITIEDDMTIETWTEVNSGVEST
jgi:hypothetical protein